MSKTITLVVPEAPAPASGALAAHRKIEGDGVRLGILDNSKGNADHLLRFLVDGVKSLLPIGSVISLRKDNVGLPAPREILDRLTAEADFVISAMAD